MNILIISEDFAPKIGGIVKVVEELSKHFSLKGNHCTILTVDNFHSIETINNINVIRIKK